LYSRSSLYSLNSGDWNFVESKHLVSGDCRGTSLSLAVLLHQRCSDTSAWELRSTEIKRSYEDMLSADSKFPFAL